MAAPLPKYAWSAICDGDAPFAPRDGGGAISFAGRMWLLGGWNPNQAWKEHFPRVCNSEVWSSVDGRSWNLVLRHAPWEGRHCAGMAAHDGKMWVVGGDCNQGHYQHDIWSSPNGIDWTCVCQEPPWGAPLGGRICHLTAVFDGYIWVMGGQNMPLSTGHYHSHSFELPAGDTVYHADCWRSKDGVGWELVADDLPWAPRCMVGGSAVLNGKIYIIGGGTYDTPGVPHRVYHSDVWATSNGVDWECVSPACQWEARSYHEVAVWDHKLWLLEGYTPPSWEIGLSGPFISHTSGQNGRPDPAAVEVPTQWRHGNRNDCWWSADGVDWHEVRNTPWAPRHAASVYVFDDSLWMVAGNNMQPDVWRLSQLSEAEQAKL